MRNSFVEPLMLKKRYISVDHLPRLGLDFRLGVEKLHIGIVCVCVSQEDEKGPRSTLLIFPDGL